MNISSVVLQFGPSVCTAAVAVVAIVANRQSTHDAIIKDLKIKVWEKRATTYVELIQAIDSQEINERPPMEELVRQVQNGETVTLVKKRHENPRMEALRGTRRSLRELGNPYAIFGLESCTVVVDLRDSYGYWAPQ